MMSGPKLLAFCSRRLSFLKHVPGLPQLLDSCLLLLTTFAAPWTLRERRRFAEEVLSWPEVHATVHRYGGLQFNVGKRELGHLHGNGVLDLLFSPRQRDEIVRDGKAQAHHTFPNSGWVTFSIRGTEDFVHALDLLALLYQSRVGVAPPSKDG